MTSRAYNSWRAMKARCLNHNNIKYPSYGARGISVCSDWLEFNNFFRDMGEPPEGMTLERIDNDGDYEPTNCRWATPTEQSNNRRNNHWISAFGETKTASQWAKDKRCKVSRMSLIERIQAGRDPEDAILAEPTRGTGIKYG